MSKDVEILERTSPFQGYFRIDRYRLRQRTHDGGWSRPLTREIFERGHAVGVLLYDPIRDEVGLIEQFRLGAYAAGWNPWLIEIVAGIIEDGESPAAVAVRESQEEAGIAISDPLPICHYLASPGGSSESLQLYCARVDATTLGGIHGLAEEAEDIRVFTAPAGDAIGWVANGRVANAMTIIALQWLALNHTWLRARWSA